MAFDFDKLITAVDWSIQQLATPRAKRIDAIRQYVGSHYSDGGTDHRVPTNFLELAVTVYTRQLAARAPRVMITPKNRDLKPDAYSMEIALNQIPDEIDLGGTVRRAVMEAMFAYAVVKVGICSSESKILGHEYGRPFADLVSIDDHFMDMSAKSRDRIQFEGNDYWVSLETAREMGLPYNVEADKHTLTGDQGDEHAGSIGSSESADVYVDRVWLRDVWLPKEHELVTYSVTTRKMLRRVSWDGPSSGPYHMLGYSDVPGNLLPLPPVALWRDLHELGNSLFRKLGRQADSTKAVLAFGGGNDDDVEALKRARDGDGIRYNGQKPEPIKVGGVDAPTLAFYLQTRDLFSYFAGNIDSLGGLAPQTDTVGQDKMLGEAASTRLKHMADQVRDFCKEIFRDLAWYEWTDPVRERIIQKPVKGTEIVVESKWSKETRRGDFLDYNFEIDAYSMQDDTPSTKMQKIALIMERFVIPLMPYIQEQGGHVDFNEFLQLVGRLSNTPEISDIVHFDDPPMQPEIKGDPHAKTMSNNTTRTYDRVSRPGATRSGKDDVMSRILMGGGVQDSEADLVGRMVS